ncbi:MAG: hypothetical protein U9R72_17135 [Chloroflexota bacterium]|nr:hypothetical protein [Chloroflexota bacterium]
MTILCGFHHVQEAARAVAESARRIEGRHFSPRPWNRFQPKDTTWWIVPSTDWPAYRHGKAMLRPSRFFAGRVECCLYVEIGFGPPVGGLYPPLIRDVAVVDDSWTWSHFLTGLRDGSVLQAAETVAEQSGTGLFLWVAAGYPSEPVDFNPYELLEQGSEGRECRSPVDGGQVWFSLKGDRLHKLEARCVRDVMGPIVDREGERQRRTATVSGSRDIR